MKKTLITSAVLFLAIVLIAAFLLPVQKAQFAVSESHADRHYIDYTEYEREPDALYLETIISQTDNEVLNDAVPVNITYRGTNSEFEFVRRSRSFTYSDELFSGSAYTYNHDLAKISIGLCLSAGTSYDTDGASYVKDALTQMDFDGIQTYKYDVTLNDATSTTAHAIAHKTLPDESTLIVIAVRGLCYGCEWADNLNVGDGSFHDGFYNAAQDVTAHLDEYVLNNKDDIGENVKYWVTGFSRAAAVANLVAVRLDDSANPENVYAYTFATPKNVNTKKVTDATDERYANIFNICFEADMVQAVVMSDWSFDRCGTTVYLSGNPSDSTIASLNAAYTDITGEVFDFAQFKGQKLKITVLSGAVASAFESQQTYADKYQAAAVDIMYFYEVETDAPYSNALEKYNAVYGERRYKKTAGKKLCADDTIITLLKQLEDPKLAYQYLCVVVARAMANGVSYNELRSVLLKLVIPVALYRDSLPTIAQAHRVEMYVAYLD